jgi:cold shock CspA family protein
VNPGVDSTVTPSDERRRSVPADHVTSALTTPIGRGEVDTFDRRVGLGTIVTADGRRLDFHAIEIADGSRDIEVGRCVAFVERRRLGIPQAVGVREL